MFSILAKEIRSFLSSLIAIIVIIVFLVANGLFIWIFNETNILDAGNANIDPFFELAPIIFIFLISAITMRSFSEEKKTGTFETLSTKPITDLSIILGKYFAGLLIVVFSILPTFIYYYTIHIYPTGQEKLGYLWLNFIGASLTIILGLLFQILFKDKKIKA